ncbi:hypothetical protein BD289DRAFT_150589 [Coniella lustricola]|uniref:Uncharacterized protein n=1 Tax=Coniella lustricola TaxID=2025994 RepID=A0A2T3AET9_9PEZI|nr:hypothetical protein BD289DRAFT_150589 [Coniella lustricola]
MSSLTSSGPAPRLIRQACRTTTTICQVPPIARSSSFAARELQWRRNYATKRIKPVFNKPQSSAPSAPVSSPSSTSRSSRGPRLSARGEDPREPAKQLFNARDVPNLPEWTVSLEGLGNKHLTAMECMEAALRYVAVATQYESEWRGKLATEANLTPHLLHWLGILLLTGNTAPRWRLGTHMLRSASELGYTPSTLTLVRTFRSMPTAMFEQKGRSSKMYRAADARFQEMIKDGKDPDALTLLGTIEAKESGNPEQALNTFKLANKAWEDANPNSMSSKQTETEGIRAPDASSGPYITLPPPREPRWEWEVTSLLGQADILLKLGREQEAVDLYRVAALELDNPHAFLQLAKLMRGSLASPERRTYLLKAAISGSPEACRAMGRLEGLVAKDETISQKERAQHELLSKEWIRLSSGAELEAIRSEDVSDMEQE